MQLILNTSTQESLHVNVSTDNASFSLRHEYSLHWWHNAIWLRLKHDCHHKGALITTLHRLSETRASPKSSLLRLSACYRQASTWFKSSNSKEGCRLFPSSAALSLPRNPPSPLFPLLLQVIGKKKPMVGVEGRSEQARVWTLVDWSTAETHTHARRRKSQG